MAFKLGMTADLCTAYNYYVHARFDDLDLDAHFGRQMQKNSVEFSRQQSKQ